MDSLAHTGDDLLPRLHALQQENDKLRRINAALIERVESGRSYQSEAYAAFRHSVVLAEQVRERTDALSDAMRDLQQSNQLLTRASEQAELAHQNLVDAIESISDGFVLFDRNQRIVLFNRHFQNFWHHSAAPMGVGSSLQDVRRAIEQSGLVVETQRSGSQRTLYRLRTGRWLQATRRPTRNEGLVILYTDITELKRKETRRREEELAQKTRLLQQTVDNLQQGVAMANGEGRLELWNHRFLQLAGLQAPEGRSRLDELMTTAGNGLFLDLLTATGQAGEQRLNDGRVVEVLSHLLPDGGRMHTLTEVTERHRHAEALRKSEQWIRLITDHVPAMIAYVNQDLRYEFINKVYAGWYGWQRDLILGQSLREAHSEEHFRRLQPYIRRALQGESVTFEVAETSASKDVCYMQRSYVPNRTAEGQIAGIFVLVKDITDRRRSAEALHQAYQHLEVRVEERTRELTQLNAQLVSEVEERRQAEVRLREAKREAEDANLSKTKFLAAVSHDLLQPLNAARLFTGSLSEQLDSGHSARDVLNNIGNSLDDVESLLGTLVDISKLDAGVIKADVAVFAVHELLDNLAVEFRELARTVGLVLDFVPSRALVKTDIHLLARVLRNFLTNAIRYTPRGRILLGCRRRNGLLSIEVWDTGEGIAEDKKTEIFQEFKRGDHQRQDRGLGLGLAIVDKIARILGHSVRLESCPGKGSMFAIEVPLGQASERVSRVEAEHPLQALDRLQQARIWVLDNDRAICQAMQSLLQGWGCEVVTALSEQELAARTHGFADPAELLVVDYHLDNDQTGLDAIGRINARRNSPLPALMITANYSNELKNEMRRQGHTLMHKPVKPMRLKTTLTHLLDA